MKKWTQAELNIALAAHAAWALDREWYQTRDFAGPEDDLSDLNFGFRARLDGARLDGARLDGASLVGASLDGASLVGARLDGARLDGARLDGARLDGARLDGASLVGASLDGASLVGARLDGASLVGASLDGASLVGARLEPIKADIFEVLAGAPLEVPYLVKALKEGKVDGSTYEGACACLVGSLENGAKKGGRQCALPKNSARPAERWFMGISKGDNPENNQVSRITLGWVEEWMKSTVGQA